MLNLSCVNLLDTMKEKWLYSHLFAEFGVDVLVEHLGLQEALPLSPELRS